MDGLFLIDIGSSLSVLNVCGKKERRFGAVKKGKCERVEGLPPTN